MSSAKKLDPEAAAVPAHMVATAELFKRFPVSEYNRLLDSLTLVDGDGELYRPHVEVVKINPKLPQKNDKGFPVPGTGGGEVYEDKRVRGVVMLGRRALQKLQNTAGIIFPPQLQKLTWNATSAFCQAAGAMKKSDGSLLIISRSKLVDLELEALKIKDNLERGREKGYNQFNDEAIDAKVKHDLLQVRENMVQNAETKAQNRVIRAALALKDSYTAEELTKPFVLVRFDQVFDMTDPAQMRAILVQAQSSQALLFPPASVDLPPDSRVDAAVEIDQDPIVVNEDELDVPLTDGGGDQEQLLEAIALGYDGLRDRFKKALLTIWPRPCGLREQTQHSWRSIHVLEDSEGEIDPKQDHKRLEKWARITLRMEKEITK